MSYSPQCSALRIQHGCLKSDAFLMLVPLKSGSRYGCQVCCPLLSNSDLKACNFLVRGSVAWWSDAKTRTYCCNSTIELLIAVDLQTRQSCVAKKIAVVEPAFFKLHCVPWSDDDASIKPAMWMWPLQTVSNQMEELRLPANANRMGRKASFVNMHQKKAN